MKKKKIYVTRRIDETGINLLRKKYNVFMSYKYTSPSRNEILKGVKNADAIICTLSESMDAEVMEAAGTNLKVISTYSTGYEHIDYDEAAKRGIYVTNTGDVLSEATADLTFTLILALGRRLIKANKYVLDTKWKYGWMPNLFVGTNIFNSTLGILGLGNIGKAVARRARGFKMNILYHNRHRLDKDYEKKLGVQFVDRDTLLNNSNYLSIHVSLEKENYHLIDINDFRIMKKDTFLINTSRGSVINEKSLILALRKNWLAGAGLDVLEYEPIKRSNPLLRMSNVIILPHIGSATIQTRTKMSEVAAINIDNIFEGKSPLFLVRNKNKIPLKS